MLRTTTVKISVQIHDSGIEKSPRWKGNGLSAMMSR